MALTFNELFDYTEVSPEISPVPAMEVKAKNSGQNIFEQLRSPDFCRAIRDGMDKINRWMLFVVLSAADVPPENNDDISGNWMRMRSAWNLVTPTLFVKFEDLMEAISKTVREDPAMKKALFNFSNSDGGKGVLNHAYDVEIFIKSLDKNLGDKDGVHRIEENIPRKTSVRWHDTNHAMIVVDNDKILHRKDDDMGGNISNWHIDATQKFPSNFLLAMRKEQHDDGRRVMRAWFPVSSREDS